MFEEIQNRFGGLFGKIQPGMCRLTMNGGVAVKCKDGSYKTYNVSKGTLTNVTNFCFNLGDEMYFVVPTRKAKVGDILLIGGSPKCVTSVDKKVITVIDYDSSEVKKVVPERHIFMGNTYFYGKIISPFANMFKNGKGMGGLMKMMMASQLFGGGNSEGGNIGQLMALSMFMGGKGNNMFDGMFDLDFDDEDEELIPDFENSDVDE